MTRDNIAIDFDGRIVDFTSGQCVAQCNVLGRMTYVIEIGTGACGAAIFLLQ